MTIRNMITLSIVRGIQIVLFPFAAFGYVIFVVKLVRVSLRTGTSATVLASLYTRYMQHRLGTRHDEPAARLLLALPSVSQLGLRLVTAPTLLGHRLTGYVPGIYRYPYAGAPPMQHQSGARTTFYDAALARHLAEIDQLVILGAGFDTRAYRLPPGTPVRCFEVDTPATQAFKRAMLKQAGVDTTGVTYVPANFLDRDWFEKLAEAGVELDKPSLFTWESVTMYLDREAVESTLRKIAGTAVGSVVAFDYVSTELIDSRSLFMRYARAILKILGETWSFGIDNTPPVRAQVAAFLESCGLALEEQRNFGPETAQRRAPAGFATAVVSPAGERS